MSKLSRSAILLFTATALVGCGNGGASTDTEYTIRFIDSADLTVEVLSPAKVKAGQKLARPSNPTKSGYTFENWYADKYCKVVFDFDMTITADWKVYANWTGGSGGESSSDSAQSTPAQDSSSQVTGTTVYFKDASWWSKDGARTSVYLWKDADKNANWPGQVMTKEGDLWKFDIDTTRYTHLLFARYAANDTDSNKDWGAKSKEILISSIDWSKPVYDISGTTEVWGDPGVSGTWTAK